MSGTDKDAPPRNPFFMAGIVCLAAALLLGGLAAWISHHSARGIAENLATIERGRLMQAGVEQVRSLLQQLEIAQRGFMITRDRAYLEPLPRTIKAVDAAVTNIRTQARSLEGYDDLVRGIAAQAGVRTRDAEKILALADLKTADLTAEFARTRSASTEGNTLDAFITRIEAQLETMRAAKAAERDALGARARGAVFLLLALIVLLVGAGAYALRHDRQRRQREAADRDAQRRTLEQSANERAAELRGFAIHLQDSQEIERHRLASELREKLGSPLAAIKLDVSAAANEAAARADEPAQTRLARAHAALDEAIKVKRHIIDNLRPVLADHFSYAAAFRECCGQFTERSGCVCNLSLPDREIRLGEQHSLALYRVLQDALDNVARHASATQVDVVLRRLEFGVEMVIADNGAGIEPATQQHPLSHGLIGMRERMRALEGSFEIDSAPGRGTQLTFRLPRDRTVTHLSA
ncbi:MAG: ATP-binding protein [Burkholderiales bacterium]|nr:ATP-binding protein [Burkholderiales bacterium]